MPGNTVKSYIKGGGKSIFSMFSYEYPNNTLNYHLGGCCLLRIYTY